MKDLPCPSRCLMACGLTTVFALLCVAPVRTQTLTNTFGGLSKSSDEPIDIESDLLTIYPEDSATFSGNVKAVQGTTTLRAREIKVNYLDGDKGAAGDKEQVESRGVAANTEESGPAAVNKKNGVEPAALTEPSSARSAANAQSTKVIEDPINIVSDWLLVNDKEKYAQFKGNVKFMQGTTRLRAREFTVSYAGSGNLSADAQVRGGVGGAAQITKIEASGDVRALFMPTGSAETKSAGATPAEAKAGDTAPQDATSGSGEIDLASATNKAAGTTETKSSVDKSEPASTSNERPGATAQTTMARGDTASVASEGSERNKNRGITKIEAKGEVIITGEKNETTTSDWLIYDLPLQWVTIGGNVVLSQGQNVLKGDRLVIDLQTGESRFENTGTSAAGGGRIRALFMPKDAGDKPGKAKRKKGEANSRAAPSAAQPRDRAPADSAAPLPPEFR